MSCDPHQDKFYPGSPVKSPAKARRQSLFQQPINQFQIPQTGTQVLPEGTMMKEGDLKSVMELKEPEVEKEILLSKRFKLKVPEKILHKKQGLFIGTDTLLNIPVAIKLVRLPLLMRMYSSVGKSSKRKINSSWVIITKRKKSYYD
jgi:hypothetical protein